MWDPKIEKPILGKIKKKSYYNKCKIFVIKEFCWLSNCNKTNDRTDLISQVLLIICQSLSWLQIAFRYTIIISSILKYNWVSIPLRKLNPNVTSHLSIFYIVFVQAIPIAVILLWTRVFYFSVRTILILIFPLVKQYKLVMLNPVQSFQYRIRTKYKNSVIKDWIHLSDIKQKHIKQKHRSYVAGYLHKKKTVKWKGCFLSNTNIWNIKCLIRKCPNIRNYILLFCLQKLIVPFSKQRTLN